VLPDSYHFAMTALRTEQHGADVAVLKAFGRKAEKPAKKRIMPTLAKWRYRHVPPSTPFTALTVISPILSPRYPLARFLGLNGVG
jgi:hypothetical protein